MTLIGLSPIRTSDYLKRVSVLGTGSIVSGCAVCFFLSPFVLEFSIVGPSFVMYRGSYMCARVLLSLINELRKRDKMRGLPSILSLFRSEFYKFNNTRARMLDSIYHLTNTLKSYFWRKNYNFVILYATLLWTSQHSPRERSGSVVECLTRDRRATGSSLTGVTALCP